MYGAHTNAYRSKLDLEGQMSMYDNYFSNFPMIYEKIQPQGILGFGE